MEAIVAVIALVFVLLGLASGALRGTPLTATMLALGAGVALGPGLGVLPTDVPPHGVLLLAELTLVVVLFVDATRVDLRRVRASGRVPGRMLLLGLPATIGLATLAGVTVLGLGAGAAFVLACLMAPTDAALGQPLLHDEEVPQRVRQAVNVESGLNDGLVAPVLAVALVAVEARAGSVGSLAVEAMRLVGLGLLVGLAAGTGAGRTLRAVGWERLQTAPRQVAVAAVPLLAWGVAGLLGGNGFVAAFVAGAAFGASFGEADDAHDAHSTVEFTEDVGDLLSLLTLLVFGSVFIGPAAAALDGRALVFVGLSLTVVRMVPIAGSLLGTGLRAPTVGLLGWFGPRGLATVVFSLEVLELAEQEVFPEGEELFGIAALGVVVSVVVHGLSARPLATVYARWIADHPDAEQGMAEHQDVAELPVRRGSG